MSVTTETLRDLAAREFVANRPARVTIGVAAFVLATTLGAQIAVPLPWGVPMTLQPLFVILAGAILGPRLGAAAMAAYLGLGVAGAPVFSMGGAGLPWLMGPTGGYLIAMPAAAFVAGAVARRDAGWALTALGLTAGVAVMYLGGVGQLILLTGRPLAEVWAVGVLPFLAGDVTKILVALLLVRGVRPTSLGRL